MKKKENCSEKAKKFDFKKLSAFTIKLKYEFGVYLELNNDTVSELTFFKEGKKYESTNKI
jgi:hypothetical protein